MRMKRSVTMAVVALLAVALAAGSLYVVAQSGSQDCESERRGGAADACDIQSEGAEGTGLGLQLGRGQGKGTGFRLDRGGGQGR